MIVFDTLGQYVDLISDLLFSHFVSIENYYNKRFFILYRQPTWHSTKKTHSSFLSKTTPEHKYIAMIWKIISVILCNKNPFSIWHRVSATFNYESNSVRKQCESKNHYSYLVESIASATNYACYMNFVQMNWIKWFFVCL